MNRVKAQQFTPIKLLKVGDTVSTKWGETTITDITTADASISEPWLDIETNYKRANSIPVADLNDYVVVSLANGHWEYGSRIQPKAETRLSSFHKAQGEGAAPACADTSSAENAVSSGGAKNSQFPDPRKKKKKKTLVDLIKSTKEISAAFKFPDPKIKFKFRDSTEIKFTDPTISLKEVESALKSLVPLNKTSPLNKFIFALTAKDAVAHCVAKLEEVRQILKSAQTVELDNTARSVLLDLDSKIRDLSSNIKYLDSNFLK